MMSKFYVGQKVLVVASMRNNHPVQNSMIGNIYEVKSVNTGLDGLGIALYNSDKSDFWVFDESDIKPTAETPENLTINGVEYIRKPAPEHEWKFGDIAIHGKYGVGIVVMTDNEDGDFYFAQSGDNEQRIKWVVERDLTFLRRADLSV